MGGKWRQEPLGTVSSYLNRGAAPLYVEEGGITVLNQKCIRNQLVDFTNARRTDDLRKAVSPDRMVRSWDVLVNSTGVGTLGRVAQIVSVPEPTTIDSHVTIVRPNPEAVEPRFLGFAMRALEADVEALGEGSTGQTELSRARLASLLIGLPPRDEQRAIAYLLGTLDDKIELNERVDATLEATARALFKSWFVDFDPVRAKASGDRFIPAGTATPFFPGAFLPSAIGEVPQGWSVAAIEDHFDAVKGVSYKGEGLADEGMPLHNLNSVLEGGGYKYEGIKYYKGDYRDRHVTEPGDVIVANTEQGHDRLLIGYAAIVPRAFGHRGIASHHIYRLRPKLTSPLTNRYICQLLNSQQMHDIVSGYANGTTVNMLPIDGVQKPQIVVPPGELVAIFDRFARAQQDRHEELVAESSTLATLRDTLLPKLISGELRIKDAERFAEAVA